LHKLTGKRRASVTSVVFIIVALLMFFLLTVIYFGHTGFFQRIYKITDKLGFTHLAQAIKEQEENITAEREVELTPAQKAAEEQIKNLVGEMSAGIERCLAGSQCVCLIPMKLLPQGYIMRFVNDPASKNTYLSVYQIKSRDWGFDYNRHFWGQTGVRIVPGSTHVFQGTQSCLVYDIEKNLIGSDKIQLRKPSLKMLNLNVNENGELLVSEVTSESLSAERDYTVYGQSGDSINIYLTKTEGKNFCFFAQRWFDNDRDLIGWLQTQCNEINEEWG